MDAGVQTGIDNYLITSEEVPIANPLLVSNAGVAQGDMDKLERDRVVREFREGKTKILISTDVLARGFDVSQVSFQQGTSRVAKLNGSIGRWETLQGRPCHVDKGAPSTTANANINTCEECKIFLQGTLGGGWLQVKVVESNQD